ncbi:MAG: hypothetical protein ACP5GS_07585, partial [Nitrososphaeria archaeon]
IKDRDHPVEQPLHYVTLKDQLRIFDPFYMLSRPKIEKMKKPVYRPWGTEIDTIKYIGNRVLTMLDYNVDEVVASLYRKMTVVDGFVFWRSVRPLGPLFSLNVRLDKGETGFIEMI